MTRVRHSAGLQAEFMTVDAALLWVHFGVFTNLENRDNNLWAAGLDGDGAEGGERQAKLQTASFYSSFCLPLSSTCLLSLSCHHYRKCRILLEAKGLNWFWVHFGLVFKVIFFLQFSRFLLVLLLWFLLFMASHASWLWQVSCCLNGASQILQNNRNMN